MKRGVLVTFIVILMPWITRAQETPNGPQSLTLEQAVNFAVEHNKELQASQMNIDLRNKMIQEAISEGLPQIHCGSFYFTAVIQRAMDFRYPNQ